MSTALTLMILGLPLAVVAAVAWTAHRSGHLRLSVDQFRTAAPMAGRLFRSFEDDRDVLRVRHDLDAIRTRFERQPVWPSSGAVGERR
ncbi:hypothetical protein [Mycobacterium sp. E740]|uniref:hypothetical protein n=1 Tax=Mycobacterium sp. E740 TaxID=1834149 RepID=UPI0007FBCFC9|nr:hypothetical protein [Mycobacterium sp. E740]OBI82245.1 hypothetical protein A5663_14690 [Mycobacterium sp. E740]